jgi:5'-nucleotidase
LLFLEKMANSPIVNANLYIRQYQKRLMRPYLIVDKAGFDILFIGVITDAVLDALQMDSEIGSFISLEEASTEVGKICNAYKDEDIDLTILLTHIGFDSDKELAALLKPEWGVDMIIGGHSHTILEQPAVVNNILITQAGVGTDQVGRFDIVVDDATNSIVECQWQLIPVDNSLAPPDKELQKYIDSFKDVVDRKYNTIICKLAQKMTHPRREEETAVGNLFADILAERAQVDVALIGSGSIRATELGPLVTLGNLRAIFPYDGPLFKFVITGAQLKKTFAYVMRAENRTGEGECYQINKGVKVAYNEADRALESLTINGQPLPDDGRYTICLQDYHYKNSAGTISLTNEELTTLGHAQVVTTSVCDVLEEYLRAHQNLNSTVEGRLEYKNVAAS